MAKDLKMSVLMDFYGEVLPEKQFEAMDLFYNSDCSLSEIAEIEGITRQGVRERLLKGEEKLRELEDKLRLAEQFIDIRRKVDSYIEMLSEFGKANGCDVSELISSAKKLADR